MPTSTQFTETISDPISELYRYIWEQFDACTWFAETPTAGAITVAIGNRVTFAKRDSVAKESVQEADLPEVVLSFQSISIVGFSSGYDQLKVSARWTVSSGTQQFDNKIPAILWALFKLIRFIDNDQSKTFYEGCVLGSCVLEPGATLGLSNAEQNRGIRGHAAFVDFSVTIDVPRSVYVP